VDIEEQDLSVLQGIPVSAGGAAQVQLAAAAPRLEPDSQPARPKTIQKAGARRGKLLKSGDSLTSPLFFQLPAVELALLLAQLLRNLYPQPNPQVPPHSPLAQ
jgi:hypothetical protein